MKNSRLVGIFMLLFTTAVFADSTHSANLIVVRQVDYLYSKSKEPMIVEHPNGTLFVTGYGSTKESGEQTSPRIWKSTDAGNSWNPVNVGTATSEAIANSDVDLAVAPDGTLYLVSMWFDNKTGEGTQIVIGVSRDAGETWRWTTLSKKRFDDRPWVGVARDGTVHVIWNDGSVYHTMSRDGGKTWSTPQQICSQGGSSHLSVSADGAVAVRVTPLSASGNKFTEGVDLVLISTDGGTTWTKHSVPGERSWAVLAAGATPRWVEPLAWDGDHLYLLWTQVDGVWLSRSDDWGATWKKWRVAESHGDTLPYYPYLTSGNSGELAAVWYLGSGANLRWEVCAIQVGTSDSAPQPSCSTPLTTDSWTEGDSSKGLAPERDTAGEYLPVLFLHDGDLAVVTPIQNWGTKRFGFAFWKFKRDFPKQSH